MNNAFKSAAALVMPQGLKNARLAVAVKRGHLSAVKLYMKLGANPLSGDPSLPIQAAEADRWPIVDALLPNQTFSGISDGLRNSLLRVAVNHHALFRTKKYIDGARNINGAASTALDTAATTRKDSDGNSNFISAMLVIYKGIISQDSINSAAGGAAYCSNAGALRTLLPHVTDTSYIELNSYRAIERGSIETVRAMIEGKVPLDRDPTILDKVWHYGNDTMKAVVARATDIHPRHWDSNARHNAFGDKPRLSAPEGADFTLG